MNIYQRIVLILGALVLFVSVGDTIGRLSYDIDYLTGGVIIIGKLLTIIGGTVLIFFALKGIKKKE